MELHVRLSPESRSAVEAMRRDPSLTPRDRDRVEIVLLSNAGWSVKAIAAHMRCCLATVRRLIHRINATGLAGLRRRRTGPPPDAARRAEVEVAVRARLEAGNRTWSSTQLAQALREDGITLSARQLRRYLRGLNAGYRRVYRTVRHKQDPVRVATARTRLDRLKKKPPPGT
jgi:transposase